MKKIITEIGPLDKKTFKKFTELIYEKVGIILGEHKEALVSARISKRMRKLDLVDYKEYYKYVLEDKAGEELVELLNAISTNTTHFFREAHHFKLLTKILENWEEKGQRKFRIWCAASSTGEEPYTLAITLKEALSDISDTKILATDISTNVLKAAKNGLYESKQLEKAPKRIVNTYFTKISDPKNPRLSERCKFQVSNDLKKMIQFGRINLAKPPFPLKGPLDIIFCRNVMIYFDNKVRKGFLDEASRLLKPGGYLMVGHAESLSGMLSELKSVEPAVYIKA